MPELFLMIDLDTSTLPSMKSTKLSSDVSFKISALTLFIPDIITTENILNNAVKNLVVNSQFIPKIIHQIWKNNNVPLNLLNLAII